MRKGLRKGMVAAVAAVAIAVPVMPAQASAADNCFIHTDDWVRCVCIPVARLLTTVTGDDWSCA